MLEKFKDNRRKALLSLINFLFVLGCIAYFAYSAIYMVNNRTQYPLSLGYILLPVFVMKLVVRLYYYFFAEGPMPENRKKEGLVIAINTLLVGLSLMLLYIRTIEINSSLYSFLGFLAIVFGIVFVISEYIESKIV